MPFPFNQTPNISFNNAFAQTPQQLVPNAPSTGPLDLGDIQGDVLIGLQKNAQLRVFFTITDVNVFKTALRGVILPLVTSCEEAHRREGELRERKVAATTSTDVETDWRAVVPMSGLKGAHARPVRWSLPLGQPKAGLEGCRQEGPRPQWFENSPSCCRSSRTSLPERSD